MISPKLAQKKIEPARLLAALEPTKVAQTALAEMDAAALKRRQDLASRLTELEDAAERNFPRLRTENESAIAAVRSAEEKLLDARRRASATQHAVTTASFEFSSAHDEIERVLIGSAEPAINAFIAEMSAELNYPPQPAVQGVSEKNAVTGRRAEVRTSNWDAINARLAAIRAAVQEAEEIRLEPDQSTIPARLAVLRSALPQI